MSASSLTPSFTLQQVSASDAEALADLRVAAMRASLEAVGRFDPVRARARFLGSFVPAHTRQILTGPDRPGFVVIRPLGDGLLLDHLYVLPAFQGRGMGAAVLQTVIAEAKAAQKTLHVGALKQSRSNDFYLRHGFRLVDVTEWDNHYVLYPGAGAG